MDSVMLFIICLFIVVLILHKLDQRLDQRLDGEGFVVYHPTNYEIKPKLPCTDYSLNFNCANQIEDLDNHYSNVCQIPNLTCRGNPYYTMARSLGRPRTCRRLVG